MKAPASDQLRLLDLSALDSRIAQAEHDRKSPPQAARITELVAQRQELTQELNERLGARDDLRAELARVEADVAVVDSRIARDTERLTTVSSPKDAQGLEHELTSLARRKSELEDGELEVMEKLETADAAVAEQEALIAAANEEGARLSAEAKQVIAQATTDGETAIAERAALVAELPSDLAAMYEKIRTRGVGAAHLRRATCEGCHMVLSGTDLNAVRAAAEDDVVTCPECGAILVRTDESGLG